MELLRKGAVCRANFGFRGLKGYAQDLGGCFRRHGGLLEIVRTAASGSFSSLPARLCPLEIGAQKGCGLQVTRTGLQQLLQL